MCQGRHKDGVTKPDDVIWGAGKVTAQGHEDGVDSCSRVCDVLAALLGMSGRCTVLPSHTAHLAHAHGRCSLLRQQVCIDTAITAQPWNDSSFYYRVFFIVEKQNR